MECLKETSNEEIIFSDWKSCQMKGFIQLLSNSGLKKLCACFCHAPDILLSGMEYRAWKQLCSNPLKKKKLKVDISLRVINWHALWIAKVHISYTIWFMISEKSIASSIFLHYGLRMHKKSQQGIQKKCLPDFPLISALKLSLCGLVVLTDKNMYTLTESRNFKTFLKENYTIPLDSWCLYVKKGWNMEWNIMLILLIDFSFIRYSWI